MLLTRTILIDNFVEKCVRMDKIIYQAQNYSLWKISTGSILEAVRFVVETNYMSHQGFLPPEIDEEIRTIYHEEKAYFPESHFYIVRDNISQIIGSIRIFRWDQVSKLPIQQKYGVNVNELVQKEDGDKNQVWHIGRFAVNTQLTGRTSLIVLKTLLAHVVHHVCSHQRSIMLAECDEKTYEKLKLLEICSNPVGEPGFELGSKTIPVYNTSKGLSSFLEKNRHLCYV